MASEPAAGPLTVVPANHAGFGDVQAILGTRGQASRCQCQRYKLAPRESFGSTPAEERAHRLRAQTSCGDPGSPETSGLVAYLDGVPVGWCAVEPRSLHCGLLTTYLDAGFTEVSRPTKRRAVVRVELASREDGSTRARKDLTMSYTTRPLDPSTWDAFADLVERNNGIFGGCWCIGYHLDRGQSAVSPRAEKEDRVRSSRAHAALVFDEDDAARGWCQYGSPEELPGIKHRREYDKDAPPLPDWRITCFFVDKGHRGRGIARAALEGALDQIARAGGGLVEAIPEVTADRNAPGRFLFSTTVELFEQYGFTRGRRVGKHAWIVSRVVDPV